MHELVLCPSIKDAALGQRNVSSNVNSRIRRVRSMAATLDDRDHLPALTTH
jgi:hypothetical protein